MSDITNIQNRNLGDLLRIFGSKQATDALKEMAKVKASTWTDIKDTVSDLSTLSTGGGTGAIINSFRDTIELSLEGAISPLSNEVNQLITDWMTENITPFLTDISNDLANFISENRVGGTAGGIAGQILAYFIPGGRIWEIIGSLIGAAIEDFFTNPKSPSDLWFGGLYDFIQDFEDKMFVDAENKSKEVIELTREEIVRNRRLGGETLTAIKNVERIINENFVEEQEERRQIIEEQRVQRRLGIQRVF